MGILQHDADIAAPVERVWGAVVDYESRPRWAPRVKEATILDGGPLREGSRIRLRIGRDRFTAAVVEMRPHERLTLLVKGFGFRVYHTYELRASGNHTTATLTGDYRGFIGRLALRIMSGSVRRDLVDELAAVKAASESGSPD